MHECKQGVNRLDVYLNSGHFNVILDAVVGSRAYLALHDADGALEPGNYLKRLSFPDDIPTTTIIDGPRFPLRIAVGISWYNVNATTGMRLVMWDTAPGNPTLTARYICKIMESPKCERDDAHIAEDDRLPESGDSHSQHLSSFSLSVINTDWNFHASGVLTTSAWIGLYQDDISYPDATNYNDWMWITSIEGSTHRAGGDALHTFNGSNWFNDSAKTPCYFGVFDYKVGGSSRKVILRAAYRSPLLIPTEVLYDLYRDGPTHIPGVTTKGVPPEYAEPL